MSGLLIILLPACAPNPLGTTGIQTIPGVPTASIALGTPTPSPYPHPEYTPTPLSYGPPTPPPTKPSPSPSPSPVNYLPLTRETDRAVTTALKIVNFKESKSTNPAMPMHPRLHVVSLEIDENNPWRLIVTFDRPAYSSKLSIYEVRSSAEYNVSFLDHNNTLDERNTSMLACDVKYYLPTNKTLHLEIEGRCGTTSDCDPAFAEADLVTGTSLDFFFAETYDYPDAWHVELSSAETLHVRKKFSTDPDRETLKLPHYQFYLDRRRELTRSIYFDTTDKDAGFIYYRRTYGVGLPPGRDFLKEGSVESNHLRITPSSGIGLGLMLRSTSSFFEEPKIAIAN